MTDEQIIKAVGICRTPGTCRCCPYHELYTTWCVCALMKDVFDLINRQKSEIERVKKRNTLLLKKKCKDINTARKIIKSEAIKEFAEKLKRYSFVDNLSLNGEETVYVEDINNLVKEMTEAQE